MPALPDDPPRHTTPVAVLELEGDAFIAGVCRCLFGCEPDEATWATGRRQLQQGVPKWRIVAALAGAPVDKAAHVAAVHEPTLTRRLLSRIIRSGRDEHMQVLTERIARVQMDFEHHQLQAVALLGSLGRQLRELHLEQSDGAARAQRLERHRSGELERLAGAGESVDAGLRMVQTTLLELESQLTGVAEQLMGLKGEQSAQEERTRLRVAELKRDTEACTQVLRDWRAVQPQSALAPTSTENVQPDPRGADARTVSRLLARVMAARERR